MENKKKVLLVSNAFYPEISPRSFRATELAKEFYRHGLNVTVISKFRDFDYTDFLLTCPINLSMWGKPILPRIPDTKIQPLKFVYRIISRLLLLFFEYPDIEDMFRVRQILKKHQGFDLMISFAVPYPVHWGVSWSVSAKNRISKVWIADCGDPYMFNRLDNFRKPFYFKYFEKSFSSKCDYITIPFEGLKSKFYPQFLEKIRVIPQGFDFEAIKLYDSNIINSMPIFIFAGSIIPGKRDLSLFLTYLSSLASDFQFIVYTNQEEWYRNYSAALGVKLQIRSYIDRLTLIYEMSKADFLVNIDTIYDSDVEFEAVPSKLIDYALSCRPILNLNSGSLDKDLINEFLNGDYSRQRVVDKSKYDIRRVAAQFLELTQ